jgi:hypothetical protein
MRDLELLRQHSDQDRQFTVIVGNQFLATHGNDIARLLDGPQWARSDWLRDSTASLLSGVWNDKGFFLEFATTAHWENADRLPERLWQATRRWAQNQAFRAETWKRHARLKIFADKWPAMAQFVLDHMRIGREAEVTMGNLSLPPSATHNICCGLYLTYVSREEQAMEEQKSTSPLTWPQLLGLQISFSSAPASLDAVLDKLQRQIGEMIAGASRLELQIDRAALEKAGVTRNQRLREIHLNETTVADVLNEITVEAGGRTTENSVLVWIYPRDSASQEKLTAILTTRAAAHGLSEFTVLTPN